jgi:hypothetical protein
MVQYIVHETNVQKMQKSRAGSLPNRIFAVFRIGIGFNQVSGSGSIRVKISHKNIKKKLGNFMI